MKTEYLIHLKNRQVLTIAATEIRFDRNTMNFYNGSDYVGYVVIRDVEKIETPATYNGPG